MSIQQFFNEVEAVIEVLGDWLTSMEPDTASEGVELPSDGLTGEGRYTLPSETFTALWQAVELLSRASHVLLADIQADQAKLALVLPDPVSAPQPKAARLYDAQGRPIA